MTMVKRDVWILAEALDNIGDFALLRQAVEGLRDLDGIGTIAVRQWHPPEPAILAELAAAGIEVLPAKTLRALWPGRRLLLYAGGQVVRSNASPVDLSGMAVTVIASHVAGGQRAALAIGASALETAGARRWWSTILGRFGLITARDKASQDRLRELLGHDAVGLTDDLAFLPGKLHDALARPAPAAHVLIAPCNDPGEGRILDPAAVARLAEAVAVACPAPATLLLAHDPRPGMDLDISHAIGGKMAGGRRCVAATTLDVTTSSYASASAVVTNRLHAMIFAILAGKPVFVIDDGNSKVAEFARRFEVPILRQSDDKTSHQALIQGSLSGDVLARRAIALARAKVEAAYNFALLEKFIRRKSPPALPVGCPSA